MDNLIWLSRGLEAIVREQYQESYSSDFWTANSLGPKSVFFFDRTGVIDPGFRMKNVSPIPLVVSGYSESFSSIMDKTALDLLAEDTPMDVFWSGGIDSTAVIVALLRNCSDDQKELIRVRYTDASIDEAPDFFLSHIDGNLELKRVKDLSISKSLEFDRLIVTGVVAEQILGADTYSQFAVNNGGHISDYPIINGYKCYTESAAFWHGGRKDVLDIVQPVLDLCPFDIKTGFDFIWWLNFVGKWQDACLLIHAGSNCSRADSDMVRNFFQTDAFQQWSMAPGNQSEKVGETYGTYKMPLKKYIYDFDGNLQYLTRKTKFGSLDPIHEYFPPIFGITENYSRINSDRHLSSASYRRLNEDRFDFLFER